jgi:hypothetical protein
MDSDYINKDYFDCSNDVDLDQCPVYQAWLAKCNQERIKQEIKEVLNDNSSGNLANAFED